MLVGSILGFGDILVFIPFATFLIDIRVAVVLMSFWSFILSVLNAIKYQKSFNFQFLKKNAMSAILGVIIGSFLIIVAPLHWIEFFLGIFILIYVIAKFREKMKEQSQKINNLHNGYIYSGGFMYGFLGGLIGASGPINVIVLEKTGHEKERLIANFAFVSVVVSIFKLSIFLWNGLFPFHLLIVFLIGLAVIALVTKLGHWIAPKIPKQSFSILILIMLFIMGVRFVMLNLFLLF
jgi:hypothetical protein